MPRYLVLPTVLMTLALVFYSTGVWSERAVRYLRPWHVAAFWSGLVADASGTYLMNQLARTMEPTLVHSVTGTAALSLMLAHAVWATWVVARDAKPARLAFSRYSVLVWGVWLVPYLGGVIAGMMKGAA